MTQMIGPNTDLYRYLANPDVKKGLVRLKFRAPFHERLATVALILLACSVLGIVYGAYGVYPSRHYQEPHDPNPAIVVCSTCALVVSLILLAGRFCSRTCYLLDPGRGCLIWHHRFLWFRRIRVVLERGEIAGVAAQGTEVKSRYGPYWSYRVVVERTAGADIPVSNWRPYGRDKCKAEADKLAKLLGCRSSIALPEL
jgi:hypothetical protein